MNKLKLVVFDLDGTIITENSFPIWVKYIVRYSAINSPLTLVRLFLAISRRVLGISDRVGMKKAIIGIAAAIPENIHAQFSDTLRRYLNEEVTDRLYQFVNRRDVQVVISTAAPDIYVAQLAKYLNVAVYVATSSKIEGEWSENFGERKWMALEEKYGVGQFEITDFFSDDHHDLPLMRRANQVYLVNPSNSTLKAVKQSGISIRGILNAGQSSVKEHI